MKSAVDSLRLATIRKMLTRKGRETRDEVIFIVALCLGRLSVHGPEVSCDETPPEIDYFPAD